MIPCKAEKKRPPWSVGLDPQARVASSVCGPWQDWGAPSLPAEAGSGRPFPAAWTVSPDSLGASSQRRVRSVLRPRVPAARAGAAGALAEGLFGGKGPALGLAEPPSRLSWGHQCCAGQYSGAPWSSAKGNKSPRGPPCLHQAVSALPAPAEGPVVSERSPWGLPVSAPPGHPISIPSKHLALHVQGPRARRCCGSD